MRRAVLHMSPSLAMALSGVTTDAPSVVAPNLTVTASRAGNVITFTAAVTGTGPITVSIDTLTLDGSDVSGDLVTVAPNEEWTYTAPDSALDATVAWAFDATGPGGGSDSDSGTVNVPANITPTGPNQTVNLFGGPDTLRQANPLGSATVDATGYSVVIQHFYDGVYRPQVLFALLDRSASDTYLFVGGNGATWRRSSSVQTTARASIDTPGWHTYGIYFRDSGGSAALTHLRDAEAAVNATGGGSSYFAMSAFPDIVVGYADRSGGGFGQTTGPVAIPTLIRGDASAYVAFLAGGGDPADYDWGSDPNGASLLHPWNFFREGTGSALTGSDAGLADQIGSADTWIKGGNPLWGGPAPAWVGGGNVGVVSAAEVPSADPTTLVLTVEQPLEEWVGSATVDAGEIDVALGLGFAKPAVLAASATLSGTTATVTVQLDRSIGGVERGVRVTCAAGWLVDSDQNTAAPTTNFAATNNSVATVSTSDGLSQGTQWVRFNRAVSTRISDDYVPLVVWDGSSFDVVERSDPTTTLGANTVNGMMHNPEFGSSVQAFDQRVSSAWNGSNLASLPLTMGQHDSLILAKHNPDGAFGYRPFILEYMGFAVVTGEPGAHDKAPPLVGYDGTTERPVESYDVSALSFPSYATAGHSASVPNIESIIRYLSNFAPIAAIEKDIEPKRWLSPLGFTDCEDFSADTNSGSGYGRNITCITNAAMLALISDAATSAQKQEIARHVHRLGINAWEGVSRSNSKWAPDGAQNTGHLSYIVCTLNWSGRGAELADYDDEFGGNETGQTFFVDQELLDALEPHAADVGPVCSLIRTVTGITNGGLTVSMTSPGGGIHDTGLTGMEMVRVSDGASSPVVSYVLNESTTWQVTLEDAGSPVWAVDDEVYFRAAYPLNIGDPYWAQKGKTGQASNPSTDCEYRNLNEWGGQALGLRALGFTNFQKQAEFEAYVKVAMQSDYPTAEYDFPSHNSAFYEHSDLGNRKVYWPGAFWADHAETIFPSASGPVTTVSRAIQPLPGSEAPQTTTMAHLKAPRFRSGSPLWVVGQQLMFAFDLDWAAMDGSSELHYIAGNGTDTSQWSVWVYGPNHASFPGRMAVEIADRDTGSIFMTLDLLGAGVSRGVAAIWHSNASPHEFTFSVFEAGGGGTPAATLVKAWTDGVWNTPNADYDFCIFAQGDGGTTPDVAGNKNGLAGALEWFGYWNGAGGTEASAANLQALANGGDPLQVLSDGTKWACFRYLDDADAASFAVPTTDRDGNAVTLDDATGAWTKTGTFEYATDCTGAMDGTDWLAIDPIEDGRVFPIYVGDATGSVGVSGKAASGLNGETVEVRIYNAADGEVVKDWASVGTITSGAWSGTVACGKTTGWAHMEARIASAPTLIARELRRFGVGHTLMMLGQSQMNIAQHGGTAVTTTGSGAISKTTGNGPVRVGGTRVLTDGPALASLHLGAISETPITFVTAAQNGTSLSWLLDDSLTAPTYRDWSPQIPNAETFTGGVTCTVWNWGTNMLGDGAEPTGFAGNVMDPMWNGTAPVDVSFTVDHYLNDGTFDAKMVLAVSDLFRAADSATGPFDVDQEGSYSRARDQMRVWAEAEGARVSAGPCASTIKIEDAGGPHQDTTVAYGAGWSFWWLMLAALRAVGEDTRTDPTVAGVTASGDTITVTFNLPNGGTLQTAWATAGVTPAVGENVVQGFEVNEGGGWTRSGFSADIVGSTVELVRDSGTWAAGTQVRYGHGGPVAYGASLEDEALALGLLHESGPGTGIAALGLGVRTSQQVWTT